MYPNSAYDIRWEIERKLSESAQFLLQCSIGTINTEKHISQSFLEQIPTLEVMKYVELKQLHDHRHYLSNHKQLKPTFSVFTTPNKYLHLYDLACGHDYIHKLFVRGSFEKICLTHDELPMITYIPADLTKWGSIDFLRSGNRVQNLLGLSVYDCFKAQSSPSSFVYDGIRVRGSVRLIVISARMEKNPLTLTVVGGFFNVKEPDHTPSSASSNTPT